MRLTERTALLMVAAALAASCGKKGPPRAPVPHGPLPPGGVEARQLGAEVRVAFTVPDRRGPQPSQALERIEVVRVEFPPGQEPPADPDAFRRRGEVIAASDLVGAPRSRESLSDRTLADATSGRVGWTLRYGVRVRDRRGRWSPLVVARDLVPVAPPPTPTRLSGEATADGVRLSWDAPSEGGPFRFHVYRAVAGEPMPERPLHREPLSESAYLDSEVETGRTYAYEIRTAAGDGLPPRESVSSAPVRVVAADRFAPAPPGKLVAVQEGPRVRLFWNPGPESDLAGYRVYRRSAEGEWVRVGTDPIDRPSFLDAEVVAGGNYAYRVTAIDRASPPNESPASEEAAVEVALDPTAGGAGIP